MKLLMTATIMYLSMALLPCVPLRGGRMVVYKACGEREKERGRESDRETETKTHTPKVTYLPIVSINFNTL